jgi:hypothetical protein
VPSCGTQVAFPSRSLLNRVASEQTWGRLFGRLETRKSPEALSILALASAAE